MDIVFRWLESAVETRMGPAERQVVQVRCYSGQRYAERPLAFSWRGTEFPVEEVLAEWHEPAGPVFRVRTPEGTFTLGYEEAAGLWWLQP